MSELTDALETLLENEVIEEGTAAFGIVRKILADDGTQNLSARQEAVYINHIEPHLEQECEEDDCLGDGNISLEDLPEAYNQQFELGGLYCEERSGSKKLDHSLRWTYDSQRRLFNVQEKKKIYC